MRNVKSSELLEARTIVARLVRDVAWEAWKADKTKASELRYNAATDRLFNLVEF